MRESHHDLVLKNNILLVWAMVVLSLYNTPVCTCNTLLLVQGVGSKLLVVVQESKTEKEQKGGSTICST